MEIDKKESLFLFVLSRNRVLISRQQHKLMKFQLWGIFLSYLSSALHWTNKISTEKNEHNIVNQRNIDVWFELLLFSRNSLRSSWMSLWLTKACRGDFSLRFDGVTARIRSGFINIKSRIILRKIPDLVKPYIMSSRHTCLDSLLSAVLRVIRCTLLCVWWRWQVFGGLHGVFFTVFR